MRFVSNGTSKASMHRPDDAGGGMSCYTYYIHRIREKPRHGDKRRKKKGRRTQLSLFIIIFARA